MSLREVEFIFTRFYLIPWLRFLNGMERPIYLRRPNILPKKTSEYPLLLFTSFIIPATYWFEMWVVLPDLFIQNPVIYWTGFLLGHFILHNVLGNFVGLLMFDTSIRGRKMPAENDPGAKYCSICATVTPARSYHCPSCDICILKRDHHCIFTSCCVGFYNHRFFFYFVFYIFIATLISLPFNIFYLWRVVSLIEISYIVAVFCPVILFILDLGIDNFQIQHLYLFISLVGVVGILLCSLWFYFHLKLILQGTVVHEMKKCVNIYNLGSKKNLEMVFGKRWHLTWISPYISSALICNGITYPMRNENEDKE